MKLCIITCHNQPDYIRALTLRAAAGAIEGVDVIVLKNRRTGLLRYTEIFARLLRVRLREKPDAYLLTFRGYEMLLPVRLLTIKKPLIYDEFINPIEWIVKEQRQVEAKQNSRRLYRLLVAVISRIIALIVSSWLFKLVYRLLVRSVDLVLSDTDSHAEVSAKLTGIERGKFLSLSVGTDESTFEVVEPEDSEGDEFTVFYYGNMLPLHGLNYVIEAAVLLNHDPVKFVLVGGNAKVAHDVAFAVGNGAKIDYQAWVEFDKLPILMRTADLCLAGPFGGTFQSQYVITGKTYQFLAMGRPVVIGENEESSVFRHKRDALIVKQADADAVAETIRWAMRNRYRLRSIGLKGQELYQRKYSNQRLAERLGSGLASLGLLEPSSNSK